MSKRKYSDLIIDIAAEIKWMLESDDPFIAAKGEVYDRERKAIMMDLTTEWATVSNRTMKNLDKWADRLEDLQRRMNG